MVMGQGIWERQLISMAEAGLKDQNVETEHTRIAHSASALESAYGYCEALTARHSRTFYLASALLPREKRRAVRALYAFCRVTDDIVDRGGPDAEAHLATWREHSLGSNHTEANPVSLAWADARSRFGVPRLYAEQLIDGIARDVHQKRYETFSDLTAYCYGAASTVGLMAMHIIGFQGAKAVPYAVKLGVALQLTNILRDVAEDWNHGRLYLPLDELRFFGITESDIAAGQVTDRWKEFMQYQIERNRRLYEEALPGIGLLNEDGRFAITAAAELYRGILDDIEGNNAQVFTRRAHLNGWQKLQRLPGIWMRSRSTSIE